MKVKAAAKQAVSPLRYILGIKNLQETQKTILTLKVALG